MLPSYVHGYEQTESRRLHEQAMTLEALLHHDTAYTSGSTVLEAGSGIGAQTIPLIRSSPGARITCVDFSAASLAEAEARIQATGLPLPLFLQADLRTLPLPNASFDHVFVCFVLEHLSDRDAALAELQRVLRPGGTVTVIEGDHGTTLFHPDDQAAHEAIRCQMALQCMKGGDANVGRRLYPLLTMAGFQAVRVSPRQVYVDASKPALVEGFIRKTFTAMVAGVRDEAIRAGLTDANAFETGVKALLRTAEPDGVFCYTFFKAVASKEGPA